MLAAMDETTPAIQDYLAAIYDLAGTDKPVIGARLARHMHISAPSITEALRRMQRLPRRPLTMCTLCTHSVMGHA